MSWLNVFKRDGGKQPAGAAPESLPKQAVTPKSAPDAGYGENPYDTYTWELHPAPDGERELKRAYVIDRPNKPDGETFNPYDTGKFSGGW